MAWRSKAACLGVDHEMFFPTPTSSTEQGPYTTLLPARRVCAQCPVWVWEKCLDWALDHRMDHGVWGGASTRERQRILAGDVQCRLTVRSRLDRMAG